MTATIVDSTACFWVPAVIWALSVIACAVGGFRAVFCDDPWLVSEYDARENARPLTSAIENGVTR